MCSSDLHEEYQDYSDIDTMVTQQYVVKVEKEGAIKFLEYREFEYFMATKGRKLRGFKAVKEKNH